MTMTRQAVPISKPEQLEKLREFLKDNKLPNSDLSLDGNLFVLYEDPEGNLIASGGLEMYGSAALLRSVAVRSDLRGQKLGDHIVNDLLKRARQLHLESVFLLTETAHDFFLKKGFADISRDDVPAALKSSSEFSFVCPVSASCMTYSLI